MMNFGRRALLAGAFVFLACWLASQRHPQPAYVPPGKPVIVAAASDAAPAQNHPAAPARPSNTLPPLTRTRTTATTAWDTTPPEPAFAAFKEWAQQYASAAAPEKARLETRGTALAQARLNALADLIQTNPERALELAIPPAIKSSLPASVQRLTEAQVNTLGDYDVLCVLPVEGREAAADALLRTARIGNEVHRVFTFGKGLDYVTHKGAPLSGIAVPVSAATAPPQNEIAPATQLLALNPNPARLLDPTELATYRATQPSEPVCTITGEPWAAQGEPTAVAMGGQIYAFSRLTLADAWAATNIAAANLDQPQTPGNLPTAASTYTEGRKRFMLFRVDFPDYAGEVMTTNQALNLMSGMSNFMAEISYGKLVIAPVGEGSDITPTMRLPNNVDTYTDMGNLLGACRTAATALGYDMNQYDFYYVCTAGKPSASFAGLGYVGGVGYWLANRYWDVRTGAHEYGHNLGLGHANWWDTGGDSMIGTGSSEEYGDVFDTMGINGGGDKHFSSYSKNKLGWILNADCPTVTTSGFYRLYAHDDVRAAGLRGLRLKRSSGDYWVEFRQKVTGNKALMNGLGLRWVGGSTTLLDTTPGSANGKNDHPLIVGRTFSDRKLGLHVTPLGKGNTYPESLDVVVNIGTFPTNQPPNVTLTASTLSAAANQTVGFTAAASDPNGDPLAFAWDFGDGNYSTESRADVSHSFGSAGEYRVACTVSDLKGGQAVGAVIVRVGNPTNFRISGRLLTTNNLPIAGVKVWTDSSHYAFTASDGTYDITRLNAGSYTVNITEPVYGEANFVNPFFNNPVAVGPSFTNADYIQFPGQLNIYTPLVAKGAVWRYLDTGVDLGTNWIAEDFSDAAWQSGAGVLGYGQGNETTTLSYGTNSNEKFITYYFRKTFTVTDPSAYTNLALEIMRDDGMVVYLNGADIYRNNLPTGVVTAATHALQAVEPDTYLRVVLPPSVVRAGTNLLAVEMHQVEPTSSDLNFDLALSGLTVTNAGGLNLVYIASPRDAAQFPYPTNLTITAEAQSGGSPVTLVRFYADGAPLAADASAPYNANWLAPGIGQHEIQVVAVLQSGLQVTSAPVTFEIMAPVATPPPPVQLSLIATGAVWYFFTGPTGAPPNWTETTFMASGWSNGPAELGYGENDERTRLAFGGDANNKWITAYFRRPFLVNDAFAITNLQLNLKRDDGAIVYLNGAEIWRDLMPTGAITHLTLAANDTDDGKTFHPFTLGNPPLKPGTNWLAVEIHQSAADSSDLSFDLSLTAVASTNRARGLWLTSPAPGESFVAGNTIPLACEVVAGSGLGVASVAYFANGALIGTNAYPYALPWADAPAGEIQLVAVATDSAGASFTSAPVSITIAAPRLNGDLISFGQVWKYLDNGSDQGSNWVSSAFDDRAWKQAAAKLGYGGDGETTTISDGGDPGFRHITAYFRKTFVVANPASFNQVLLRLVCDDGAVVYVNGREVYRQNLQAGLISFNSLATNAIGGAAETTPTEVILATTNFVAGTNCIAVEIHQSSITSSDTGFDLALVGQITMNITTGIYLTTPANGTRFYSPASISLAAYAAGGPVSRVEYFANGLKIGEASAYPYNLVWSGVTNGSYALTARATFIAGGSVSSGPMAVTVSSPPPLIEPVATTLIAAGAEWRYWDNVVAVAQGWPQPAFDDANWQSGVARLGWGLDGERTEITSGRVTHYFRRWFTVTNPALYTDLVFQLARDDGAVVYLNGREVFRSNMPAGTITASTTASTTVNTPDETTYFETTIPVAVAGLQAGSNVVAVELHQGSATSSDGGFDLQLTGLGSTEPRIYFTAPLDGQQLVVGQPIRLEAYSWAGAGLAGSPVSFFANGAEIGQTEAGGTTLIWTNAPFGNVQLVAQVNAGGTALVATPVNIIVGYQPTSLTLMASNANWRFWDRGTLPAANWTQRSYIDSGWSNGMARLGYGGDGEITPVSYGANANAKYITTYFRQWFQVPANVTLTNLNFQLLRDDGAVVYLNGSEVFRSNMPTGAVGNSTLASSAISGADELTYFTTAVPVAGLLSGSNLVAVELHQSSATSSDLGFNLQLLGNGYSGMEAKALVNLSPIISPGLRVAWSTNMFGWSLYSASNLAPGSTWTKVSAGIVQSNGFYLYSAPPNGQRAFYRLELR